MARLNIIGPCNPELAAEVVGATGNVSISSEESRWGIYSILMAPEAGVVGARFQVQQTTNNITGTWSQAAVYLDFYIMLKEDPSATLQLAVITKAGGASQAGVDVGTDRKLQLWYTNGSNVKTNLGAVSAAMPRNVIHRITLVATALATGGSSTCFLRLNGVTVGQGSALTITSAPANSGEAFFGTTATTGCRYHLFDIRVDNAAIPGGDLGSGLVFTRVIADGVTANWTPYGSANAWRTVKDDVAPETTLHIASSTNGQGHLFALRNFSRWFGAGTVHAVKLHCSMHEKSGTTSSVSLWMRENLTSATSSAYTGLAAAASWLGYLRELAPDGAAWTMAKIDALQVGVVLNSATTTTVQCSTVYCYAEVTPDDGLWLFVDWYKRFHAGSREWPADFEAFRFGLTAGDIPVNATPYFTRLSIRRGRARSTDEIAPGRASFTLLNTANDGSGDPLFNVGTTASGGLDSRLGQLGHRVRIVAARNGNLYGLFYGYTSAIRQSNVPGQTPRVDIEAVDGLEWMRTKWVGHGRTGTYISDNLGLDTGQTLGYRLGFQGTTIAPLWRIEPTTRSLTHYWYNGEALADARKLAFEAADGSWWFVDAAGAYRYRSGAWHTNNESMGIVPVASATIELREYSQLAGAQVMFAKFTDDSAFNALWTMDVDSIPIPAGTSRLRVEWGEPAFMTLSLTATTDYLVNSLADGSGTNLTANVTISNSNADGGLNWMTGGELVITNSGAAGFMTFGQWRGQRVFWDTGQMRRAGSSPFLLRQYEFMSDATDAQGVADDLSTALTDTTPQPRTTVTVIPSGAAAEELLLKLDLGRKANFQNTANPALGGPIPLNAVRTVQGLTWEFSPGAPWRATYEIE